MKSVAYLDRVVRIQWKATAACLDFPNWLRSIRGQLYWLDRPEDPSCHHRSTIASVSAPPGSCGFGKTRRTPNRT